jgi:hypothetical protein
MYFSGPHFFVDRSQEALEEILGLSSKEPVPKAGSRSGKKAKDGQKLNSFEALLMPEGKGTSAAKVRHRW